MNQERRQQLETFAGNARTALTRVNVTIIDDLNEEDLSYLENYFDQPFDQPNYSCLLGTRFNTKTNTQTNYVEVTSI